MNEKIRGELARVLAVPVYYGPVCGFVEFGHMVEDEEGYPYYSPAIDMSERECEGLAQEVGLSPQEVYDSTLAHERGHALAYFMGLDWRDESLAWSLAALYFGPVNEVFRDFALRTYVSEV